ncbi:MAG: glycoside hydrolase family 95 protein, partial [Pedobacter sp.]|nr:glycoside hydrolase family 95 protein [Pedobacter sp.]
MDASRTKTSITLILLFALCAITWQLAAQQIQASTLNAETIWDNKPATDWMTECYPIGNGRIGGMIYGGVNQEHIQFNDNSLWSGDETARGMYQAFGDLFIDFDPANELFTNYRRELDLSNAVHKINYTQNNVSYSRQYFCSFPDKVMIMRLSANKKGAYNATISLKDDHGTKPSIKENLIQFSGYLANGMAYQASALVKIEGGSAAIIKGKNGNDALKISKSDVITIIFTAATDFVNERVKNWKGEKPALKIKRVLAQASEKQFSTLLNNHITDYKKLYSKVSLRLDDTSSEQLSATTKQQIINYKKHTDQGLEALLFKYGRYLLISSSRKGGLPANLQGLWNNNSNPPWGSDYHSNINLQMNYWLAEPTNLSECAVPYLDYINSIREVAKLHTQKEYGNVRGWTVRTENNIFGGDSYTWNTPGSAWYAQSLWDHYTFTEDKGYLKNFAYPILKEITQFWEDHLKRRPDGTL